VDTPQLTQAELDALVDEAHALRLKTAAHAHGNEGAKRAVLAGIDSIEHGSFLQDDTLQLMKSKGTCYVPTLMAVQGFPNRFRKASRSRRDSREGGCGHCFGTQDVCKSGEHGGEDWMGTDAAVYPHGRNAEEFIRWWIWG